MRVPKTIAIISAIVMLMLFPDCLWGQSKTRKSSDISVGGIFSPMQSGVGISLFLDDGSFRDFSLYVDYSDILDKNPIQPGVRFSFYHNLRIYSSAWNDFPFVIYAGPGAMLGYMHDRNETDYCFVAGVSGCFGIMFKMWHKVNLGVETHVDVAMKFNKNSTVSFFREGAVFSYIPMVKIHYGF